MCSVFRPQVDFTGRFAFVLELEPVIDRCVNAECRQADGSFTDEIVRGIVFVEHLHCHLFRWVQHIHGRCLVPHWCLGPVLVRLRLELLQADTELREWILFAEHLCASVKLGFDDFDLQYASCFTIIFLSLFLRFFLLPKSCFHVCQLLRKACNLLILLGYFVLIEIFPLFAFFGQTLVLCLELLNLFISFLLFFLRCSL